MTAATACPRATSPCHRPVTELHHLAQGELSTGAVAHGKQVDELATEVLIRNTVDPSMAAVAARHQQERLQRDVYSGLL